MKSNHYSIDKGDILKWNVYSLVEINKVDLAKPFDFDAQYHLSTPA
jgi:hypothetical protein